MTIGNRIKELRTSLGMTQDELAKLTGYKSRSSIQKIESGKRNITQSAIVSFARALKVTPSVIMGWNKEIDNKEGSKMKILIENDGTNDVKVQSVTPSKRAWEEHCCAECRYFHRHYVELGDTGAYIPTNDGHCYPPRDYAHIKIQSYKRTACIYFKPTEYED